jgi:hypothetical protein
MKIFSKNLTNRSIETLRVIIDAIEARQEITDIIAACKQVDILKYAMREGMQERFGSRVKKCNELSLLFQIINGLLKENNELRSQIKK